MNRWQVGAVVTAFVAGAGTVYFAAEHHAALDMIILGIGLVYIGMGIVSLCVMGARAEDAAWLARCEAAIEEMGTAVDEAEQALFTVTDEAQVTVTDEAHALHGQGSGEEAEGGE